MGAISTVQVSVALSVVCLVVVLAGGWYLQSSLIQLNTQVMEQDYLNTEQTKHIEELNEQIIKQNNQISEQQVQLEQLNIIIDVILDRNGKHKDHYEASNNTNYHGIVKRQEQSSKTTTDKTIIKLLQGRDGRDGSPGITGDIGPRGNRGEQGPPGPKGEGRDGRDGRDGVQGIKGDVGLRGDKGYRGLTGPKGEPAGGLVYVRWGHDSCPSTGAQLVYSGRAAGPHYTSPGGGTNPQCLPLDPNYLKYQSGRQSQSLIYGAEYENTNSLVANSHDGDVPCAVCYVPTRTTLYMLPAKYTCPTGWTTEYYGYLMSAYKSHHRQQYSCVDHTLKTTIGSSPNHNGYLFYIVEAVCGALPCPPYEQTKELSCAVCTK
ncbi:short-chain collagen C4-like [Dysidea avara]|uniref:short-chain collagen C4-like n=1 Tax=Dysidea avara TaxID=196820 RepID=UPI00332EF7C7